ncbi:MAG TPA: substrate-binding domain-containing protein [Vicinamibacteria bacterium]|nr:substrate-binding domain-containing protein [Vicinamibacteria bacterium]
MRRPTALFFALGLAVTLAPAAACRKSGGVPGKDRPLRIAVVPKGTNMDFWRTVHAGAIKGERDLEKAGVRLELIWKGPLREDDREQQVQVVESFASQGVDGIVLAPLDERALVRPVEEAKRLSIPTVIIDSALDSDQIVSFVATDNRKGGELAADEMGRLLGGKGKVILLRFQDGSASTTAREEGFLARLGAGWPGVKLLSSDQHAGATRDTAKRAAENLLNRFGAETDGLFVVNESTGSGTLLALQDGGYAGKIRFLGFDSTPAFVTAMRAGQMHAFVLQAPFRMAELGVKTLVDHLQGKTVPRRIDTGVVIVTPANLDTPPVQELLKPPLDTYLPPGE